MAGGPVGMVTAVRVRDVRRTRGWEAALRYAHFRRVARGASVLVWERRHNLLLWRGRVDELPLEKERSLCSSPRVPVPR
ncbi:hypothetical protein ACWEBX_38355 [Streptomyces sp. NPDC005070]